MKNLTFSFDIGHASIGWSAIEYEEHNKTNPAIIGTGVVLFEADSCLASERREHRRLRRTIRSRRKRIERMAKILIAHGVLTPDEVSSPGHPAPFHLAARALKGKQKLSAIELWHVLRWYAHNRGYDGNKQWSGENDEDAKRVTLAKDAMKEHGTKTMAETILSILELNIDTEVADFNVRSPKYKKFNLAFPRDVVEREVQQIIDSSSSWPNQVKRLITAPALEIRQELAQCKIKLPKRYSGSILFGQLIPRFDNRIIARCPITWVNTYREAMAAGKPENTARKEANKYAKVPNANSIEFYEYRFARVLANIRVNDAPLSANNRRTIMKIAREKGRFTKKELEQLVRKLTNNAPNNLKNYFHLAPDADEALVVVPTNEKQIKKGRAPYARPILRQVVQEVLNGFDPTKPALSPSHPNGEPKDSNGILYALSDPNSDVFQLQQKRSIEQQTNNHLIRHRMLIFGRLLKDMVKHYANGNPSRIKRCCVEVNRELREFSGLTAQEITKHLNEKLRHFKSAVAHLEKHAPHLPRTGGLIRKCRIAMDLNWRCPYTGKEYSANDLPKMDKDHIIPFATRNTNAMSALVLTFPEVNRMKGKRTALEFIRTYQGQQVENKTNLEIWTEKRFKDFVDKLDKKGALDDQKRKSNRKKLLLIESTPQNGERTDLGFTEGQLTQSSQLARMAASVVKNKLPDASIISIPGQVTAEVRKSWKIMGCLVKTVPDICEELVDEETNCVVDSKLKDKNTIRGITHLHHAVDACTIGLIPHLIPCGNNGAIWKMLIQRSLRDEDISTYQNSESSPVLDLTDKKRLHLRDIPKSIKSTICQALSEKRVVRHVPADMSGAKFNEQYRGIIDYKSNDNTLKDFASLRIRNDNYGITLEDKPILIPRKEAHRFLSKHLQQNGKKSVPIIRFGQTLNIKGIQGDLSKRNGHWQVINILEKKQTPSVTLRRINQQGHTELWKDAPIQTLWDSANITLGAVLPVKEWISKSKLMGLQSEKMKNNSAALTISSNYGVVISPVVSIIRHVSVYKTLYQIRKQYNNRPIIILRTGMVISIKDCKNGKRNEKWRISSVKDNANGPALDLQSVESSVGASVTCSQNWLNVSLKSLLKYNIKIHPKSYIGEE